MDAVRYAMDKVDEAERAVFSLKLFAMSEREKTYYKKRVALEQTIPAISEVHEGFKALVDKMMDISDTLEPFYEEGGDR